MDLTPTEREKVRELQSRIDRLVEGTAESSATHQNKTPRLFAIFDAHDAQRAAILAALCIRRAQDEGGVEGLKAAVDTLYEKLGSQPVGLVEHAAKLFVTQSPLARHHLRIRSAAERRASSQHAHAEPAVDQYVPR